MLKTIYYYLGYDEEEVKPDEKTVKQRHLLMKQIKDSKLKLKSFTDPSIQNIEDNIDIYLNKSIEIEKHPKKKGKVKKRVKYFQKQDYINGIPTEAYHLND